LTLRESVRAVLQEILEAEMTDALGAAKGERTAGRLDYYGRTLITVDGGAIDRQAGAAGAAGARWSLLDPCCSSAASVPSRLAWTTLKVAQVPPRAFRGTR
jgi:hypothetical protein